ncbi:MAG: phosphate ABC transporter substrate-binding protein [Anaerolineae bacterium]|nr:phosphate ABC transporter substrate-binding protein [Anaerolineae bacterium]
MRFKLMLVAIGLVFLISGCANTPETPAGTAPSDLSGKVSFAGSTTVQPLAAEIGQVFNAQYPDVTLDIAAGGSSVGIKAIHDGTVDIGMASRHLKPEEAEGVTPHQIAVDVIAVVVQENNPVRDLTMDQLRDIYLGKITNWQEVGGSDEDIMVVVRDKNSGTRGAFDEIVLNKDEPTAPNLEKALTAGDMAAKVLENINAIGYVGFGNIEEGLALVNIDGAEPSEPNARDGSYKLTRPLLLITGPLSQPLAQEFIDFAIGEQGQQVVVDKGWVSVR